MSVCDSQYSHFNPSINEPVLSMDADPEEREMHAFLDCAGIFQVNVKAQLAQEQKAYSSPSVVNKQLICKKSPSFLQRRLERLSTKEMRSTAGSSATTGAKS